MTLTYPASEVAQVDQKDQTWRTRKWEAWSVVLQRLATMGESCQLPVWVECALIPREMAMFCWSEVDSWPVTGKSGSLGSTSDTYVGHRSEASTFPMNVGFERIFMVFAITLKLVHNLADETGKRAQFSLQNSNSFRAYWSFQGKVYPRHRCVKQVSKSWLQEAMVSYSVVALWFSWCGQVLEWCILGCVSPFPSALLLSVLSLSVSLTPSLPQRRRDIAESWAIC